MRMAVGGGSGLVGALVVGAAERRGYETRVLARSSGVDVLTGRGLDSALAGVDVVIDVTNRQTVRRARSVAFFETATRTLLAAGARAGVRHHVVLSIVGVDRVALGYYAGKLGQERLALGGPLPASVLRATQFHEFTAQLLDRSRGPLVAVPTMRSATIAAAEVADALVELAGGAPVGLAPELAGPEVHAMPDLVRRLIDARGSRLRVVPVRLPGPTGRAMASGGLLPLAGGPRGRQTFAQWLAGR